MACIIYTPLLSQSLNFGSYSVEEYTYKEEVQYSLEPHYYERIQDIYYTTDEFEYDARIYMRVYQKNSPPIVTRVSTLSPDIVYVTLVKSELKEELIYLAKSKNWTIKPTGRDHSFYVYTNKEHNGALSAVLFFEELKHVVSSVVVLDYIDHIPVGNIGEYYTISPFWRIPVSPDGYRKTWFGEIFADFVFNARVEDTIYHKELGAIYYIDITSSTNICFWAYIIGSRSPEWLYVNESVFPWIWFPERSKWIYVVDINMLNEL